MKRNQELQIPNCLLMTHGTEFSHPIRIDSSYETDYKDAKERRFVISRTKWGWIQHADLITLHFPYTDNTSLYELIGRMKGILNFFSLLFCSELISHVSSNSPFPVFPLDSNEHNCFFPSHLCRISFSFVPCPNHLVTLVDSWVLREPHFLLWLIC